MSPFSEAVLLQSVALLAIVWLLVAAMVVPQVIGRRRARAGDFAGAERWYGRALGRRAKIAGQGNIAVAQFSAGDLEGAERRLRQVFAEARGRRDTRIELITLVNLGACLIAQRRLGEAVPLLAWAAASERAKPFVRAAALCNLAWISYLEFDFAAAQRGLDAARLKLPRPKQNLKVLYPLLSGRLLTRAQRWDEARHQFDLAVVEARRADDSGLAGQVLLSRGLLDYLAGDREAGLELALKSAANLKAADRGDLGGRTLLGLAYIARGQGDEQAAARLEEAAHRFRGVMPMPSPEDCAAYLRSPTA